MLDRIRGVAGEHVLQLAFGIFAFPQFHIGAGNLGARLLVVGVECEDAL